jgi:hypothetical protein
MMVAQMWKGLTLYLVFSLNLRASFQWVKFDNSYIMNTRPLMQTNKRSRAAPFVATWSFQTIPRVGWHDSSSRLYDVRILKVCHLREFAYPRKCTWRIKAKWLKGRMIRENVSLPPPSPSNGCALLQLQLDCRNLR